MPKGKARIVLTVLLLIGLFAAWGLTLYSLRAPLISGLPDHDPRTQWADDCRACHGSPPAPGAPEMPHWDFPSCGFCHR